MSGFGRKRGSVWDSKEDTNHHHHHSSVNSKSASYYRDKEPALVRFNAESTEARPRSRVAQNNDNSYYSEQDETRQQFNNRSGSRSNSRSRSPIYRSYDRHNKTRTRVSPLPIREFNKRGGDQSSDYGWEDKVRKSKYHTDDFREQAMKKNGVRSYDYNTDDGVSDPRLRRHRSEWTQEKETQRRDSYGEGEFRRSSNIPCKFFAAGVCRNGKHCRFSHHQDNNFYRRDNHNHNGHNNKWNDAERLDNGKFCEMEVSRASKKTLEPKGNGSSWIDDMEMSPDWNYVAQSLKNPVKEEPSQSQAVKDNRTTNVEEKSIGMLSYGDKPMVEEPIAALPKNYNNPVNIAPVQAFNQNTQNRNVLPYQSSLTAERSQQVVAATTADLLLGSNLSNPENGEVYQDNHHSVVDKPVPVQNTVTREQIDQISSISASIAQFLANGQPIPQLQQALQMTSSMAVQPNQATTALQTQSNSMSNNPNQLWGPAVTASQQVISNLDKSQELVGNPKASEENGGKKTDETSKEEEEGKKTGEDTKDAENVVNKDEDGDDDDDDDGSDEDNKKGKDPKEMRAFKFALVEIVKELLKPAWKEGMMNKDGYKNIVKKVVEKVTGSMQSGNIPQTQEKIDHYMSASKPKLTKLVQAYISKVKKN